MNNISVVVNTYNSAKTLNNCLKSVKWAREIIIIDMGSADDTVKIAEKYKSRIFFHQYTGYVEPARNFGISKASNEWILILDSDEIISKRLRNKLINISAQNKADFVSIPRKNIIFSKWIRYAGWWPDHKIRFFKKNYVSWSKNIHETPLHKGKGLIIKGKEEFSIIHNNIQTLYQLIERINRYTEFEATKINKKEIITKYSPFSKATKEFINRFVYAQGFKEGYIGLLLSFYMGFYFFLAYSKALESKKRLVENKEINVLFMTCKILVFETIKMFFWIFLGLPLLLVVRKIIEIRKINFYIK